MTIELQALTVASAVEHSPMHCLSDEDSVCLKASSLFDVLPSLVIHGNHIPIYNKERKGVEGVHVCQMSVNITMQIHPHIR